MTRILFSFFIFNLLLIPTSFSDKKKQPRILEPIKITHIESFTNMMPGIFPSTPEGKDNTERLPLLILEFEALSGGCTEADDFDIQVSYKYTPIKNETFGKNLYLKVFKTKRDDCLQKQFKKTIKLTHILRHKFNKIFVKNPILFERTAAY